MFEIIVGSSSFAILGCTVLLATMLREQREDHGYTCPDFEPGCKVIPIKTVPFSPPVFKTKATRKKKSKGVQDASKHMTISQLRKIQTDNYCGEGTEYNAEQVDAAIMARAQKKADNNVSEAIKILTLANINF